MSCKYGKLKSRVGRRTCRKKPRGSSYRSRSGRGRSRVRGGCKYGMLKSPTKGRRCRKAPKGASRRTSSSYRSRRKPTGMARRGSKCTSFRRVRVRTGRGYTMQKRCRRFVAR